MLEDLNPKSPIPLYEQIASRLKAAVASGELRPGDLLPSVRHLAGRARINPATVTQAYRSLEGEGFVEARHGAGTYVRDIAVQTRSREREKQARALARDFLAAAARYRLTIEELQHAIRHEVHGGTT
jgi:GntR family transcriptional regulator